ncbi:Ankyrin repeat-containing domain protein [Naviculisporaceae sp. PSN 640]
MISSIFKFFTGDQQSDNRVPEFSSTPPASPSPRSSPSVIPAGPVSNNQTTESRRDNTQPSMSHSPGQQLRPGFGHVHYHRDAFTAMRDNRAPTELLRGAYNDNPEVMLRSIMGMVQCKYPTGFNIDSVGPHPLPSEAPFADGGHGTALHFAALKGNKAAVDFLLSNGARDNVGSSALCNCPTNKLPFYQNILDSKLADTVGWTALHLALCHGQTETAETLLLNSGTSLSMTAPNTPGSGKGVLAVHTAAYGGHPRPIFELIIRKLSSGWGRDFYRGPAEKIVNVYSSQRGSPLHYAVAGSVLHGTAAIDALFSLGADIDIEYPGCPTPLSLAIQLSCWAGARRLLHLGASIDSACDGYSALFWAIYTHGDGFHPSLTSVGNPSKQTRDWAEERDAFIHFMLQKHPAELNNRDLKTGQTPATYAAMMARHSDCHIALLDLFRSLGADMDLPNTEGNTALHCLALAMRTPYLSEDLYDAIKQSMENIMRCDGHFSLEHKNMFGSDPIDIITNARDRVMWSGAVDAQTKNRYEARCANLLSILVARARNTRSSSVSRARRALRSSVDMGKFKVNFEPL